MLEFDRREQAKKAEASKEKETANKQKSTNMYYIISSFANI
jgi:hypothetical protein